MHIALTNRRGKVEWNRADDVSSGGRFVKFPLTAFFIFVLAWPSLAQDMNEIAVRAKRNHNDCFYNSATAQLQAVPSQRRKSADVNLIAEQAFVACTTEEQVLATIISSGCVRIWLRLPCLEIGRG